MCVCVCVCNEKIQEFEKFAIKITVEIIRMYIPLGSVSARRDVDSWRSSCKRQMLYQSITDANKDH